MKKDTTILVRTTEEIKSILLKQAEDNRRSMAAQIEWLILQEEKRIKEGDNK
ncbi:hypothetical protein [Papillibacter cinnamivorans]|uniref:hypothetical protein n=1 Tax=Papillibacter cinnamivorans TaxID=100176 RepID=UPI00135670F0|nr:hypothetical protein [Papillibacter cinnamivorans]